MPKGASELILNADGSVYHLNLLPEDISDTVITVGDPDRVSQVSRHFDTLDLKKGKREFITHTGQKNGKGITVISTGIGTDNIDIVLNELDALVNINLATGTIKRNTRQLDIIRIGTSGAIQPDIEVDCLLLTKTAIGMDALLRFYDGSPIRNSDFEKALDRQVWPNRNGLTLYVVEYDEILGGKFDQNHIRFGTTITAPGFYGPQFRKLRLKPSQDGLLKKLGDFSYKGERITNIEMETAGIYGLAKLLGHHAISLNAILANRATAEFSKNPQKTVDELIEFALDGITR